MAGPSVLVRILGDFTNFSKSAGDVGKAGESAASRMHSAFSNVLGTLNRTGVLGPFGDALGAIDEAMGKIAEHGKTVGDVMLGVGGAMVGVGLGLQALGSKDQAAHQQLQAAVEATGASYDDYAGKVEQAIKTQEHYGTTANVTQDALRALTQATHDPQKALDLLGTAANVAAAKHEDLNTAATQVGKVYNGNTKLLKEYGVTIDKTTGKTQDGKTATQALADVTAGQASAAADTFMGKLNGIKAHVEDAAASFGEKYGPAITAAGAALTGVGAAAEIGSAAINALKDSQLVQKAATEVATAAQWLWNAAMDANPIGIIILAVAALVAAIIYLATQTRFFQTIWQAFTGAMVAAFNWVKAVALDVFRWIQANWPLLVGILTGPIGIAVALIYKYWDQIKAGASAAVAWVRGVWDGLVGFFQSIPGRIANMASGMWNGMLNAFRSMVNGIIDIWNGLHFTLPKIDAGPIHIGGETIGVPQIPHMAAGGLITGDGLIYAHAGEAIIPAPGRTGPAVVVHNANFETELDIDTFMRRAAWVVRTAAV